MNNASWPLSLGLARWSQDGDRPTSEYCIAEWQSRSRTEIILKCLGVHISTLILVAQFGSSLEMPLRAKVWLVIRAAVFPLWSAISLGLNFLAALGIFLQSLVEEETTRKSFLACRAIGMYSVAAPRPGSEMDDYPRFDDDPRIVVDIPGHIPLSEAACFAPLDFQPQNRTSKPLINRVMTVFLSLAYVVQATVTAMLVVRRSRYTYLMPVGIPMKTTGADDGKAITSFEMQVFCLVSYGIPVALVYIVLQLTNVQWRHSGRWRSCIYSTDLPWTITLRSTLGLCTNLMLHCAINDWLGFATLLQFLAIPVPATVDRVFGIINDYRELTFFCILTMLAGTRIRWKRLRTLFHKVTRKVPDKTKATAIRFRTLCGATFRLFDYARQDPTEFHIAETLHSFGPSLPRAQYCLLAWYVVSCLVFALAPLIYGFTLHDSMFKPAKQLPTPEFSMSGCAYETELKPWMWKDPLADKLWAF